MIFIGNCVYEPPGLAPGWRERLDDGLLDVRYVAAGSPWCRARLVAALLTGQLGRSKVYRREVVRSLEVRSLHGPLRLACDGETFDAGGDAFMVEKHPSRLAVYARFDA
jgi:undecaprenyl-diphosphatase